MAQGCCGGNGNVMLLTCSGGSNVGQLANQAAIELTQEGFGKMFCLAGVGGQISGFVQSAKDAPLMIVIDGCQIGCAKAICEKAEVPLRRYLVLTDEGIAKNKDFNLDRSEIERVKKAVKDILNEKEIGAAVTGNAGTGCCCSSC